MLTLFGHPGSTCTRKVLTTLAELGVPYELSVVELGKAEHKQPAHLARQPFGQIPTIDDDGFTLYESRAICRYLNDKVKGPLIPGDLQGRARMEQWISVETSNYAPHAMKFVYHYAFKRPQEEEVLAKAGTAIELAAGILDAQLATSRYLAGDGFSLADVGYMPYTEYMMGSPAEAIIMRHANLARWWGEVRARPSWQKVSGKKK